MERQRFRLLFVSLRKFRALKIILVSAFVFVLFVIPPSYAAHGYTGGVLPAVKAGITTYLISLLIVGFTRAFIIASIVGYGIGVLGDEPPNFIEMSFTYFILYYTIFVCLLGFILGTGVSLISDAGSVANFFKKNMRPDLRDEQRVKPDKRELIVQLVALSILVGIFIIGCIFYFNWNRLLTLAFLLLLAVSVFVGFLAGGGAGSVLKRNIGPGLFVYYDLRPFFKVMLVPLIGFSFGYLLIAFVFANSYWAVWRSNQCCSFKDLPQTPSFSDFFYFSIVTIATLGYGDITPSSPTAKMLTCIEVIIGIGWVTIVFAAVLAYLQPQFAKIVRDQSKRRSRLE